MNLLHSLRTEFEELVGFSINLPSEYLAACNALCRHLESRRLRDKEIRAHFLLLRINEKFDFNREAVARVYSRAVSVGVIFNFHEKKMVQRAFDSSDQLAFALVLQGKRFKPDTASALSPLFKPISRAETLSRFRKEVSSPSKLRIEEGSRSVGNEILLSAFSAFLFSAAEEEVLHEFFDRSYHASTYEPAFWLQLRRSHPELYSRERTLDIVRIDQPLVDRCASLETLRDSIFSHIAESYSELANHGHLAFWIEPLKLDGRSITWQICCEAMLFAEKHDEVLLRSAYFRSKKIASDTVEYLGELPANARFEIANEGFTYKDTFVCPSVHGAALGTECLLVLFQKNKRDETIIPCPACRSHEVQGNSYPTLGVRSWECGNLLCPDRSKYNRGKRYSFKSLLMQEAIDEEESQIAPESVRAWSRDVQVGRTEEQALEMLLRHYSLVGDGVHLFGVRPPEIAWGRRISDLAAIEVKSSGVADAFFKSAWFQRYAFATNSRVRQKDDHQIQHFQLGAFSLIQGNSAYALMELEPNDFDGAVTSPPYFNAREYSQWPNIYCYLNDMRDVATASFRALKPGSIYLYNIFDYFDNENSLVLSAMGRKRIILSAYTADIFRRVGFVLAGSVTWDKGEIEGKRGFNAGNFSPYYQSPFNCWEHILVFVKPNNDGSLPTVENLPAVLRAQPVLKMVRGENTHGHTAPFPLQVPSLIKSVIPRGCKILDPFGGSCTTARAMIGYAAETVCIEQQPDYCRLALDLYSRELGLLNAVKQNSLFDR